MYLINAIISGGYYKYNLFQLVLDEILCCPCVLICKGRYEYIKLLILTNIE